MANRYSVYNKKTDAPIVIYGTSKECANAMGIRLNSFYKHIVRMRKGKTNTTKWLVFEDEKEEDDGTTKD